MIETIFEMALLTVIYSIWILSLVYAMVSSEQISLTVATLPFIVTLPFALILAINAEVWMPGLILVDMSLTVIVGVLLFVRWVMAIIGE